MEISVNKIKSKAKELFLSGIERVKYIWGHAGFQKYLRNTGWMFFGRVFGFFTSFFTVIIVTRYLGPENLGRLEYAQSFVAIISVFASLGIDQILYRELIKNPESENELLGTAFFTKFLFGITAFLLSIILSIIIGNDLIYNILITILSLTFIINPIGTVGILFNAKVKSKYVAIGSIIISFAIPLFKIIIIFLNKGIIFFSLTILAESIIISLYTLIIYIKKFNGNPKDWKFNIIIFKNIMRDSWPLLVSSLSGYIYAKMDQIMILHYLDPKQVGIYGVAVKITQMWSFLPGLIISSLFPAIVNAEKNNFITYSKRIKKLFWSTNIITFIISIPIYIFSYAIIKIIFGDSFIDATSILKIYVWISITINLIVLTQHFLIIENLEKFFLYSNIIGAILNIILNIILIPRFGTYGAATGTLLSYLSVIISLFIFKKTRERIFNIVYETKNG